MLNDPLKVWLAVIPAFSTMGISIGEIPENTLLAISFVTGV